MPITDYYKTLGVASDAKPEAIKSAYRKLAKQHHPDRNKGSIDAEKKFSEINEAYEVLGNDENRKKYDQLVEQQKSGRRVSPIGFTDASFDNSTDWDSILAQMFGFGNKYSNATASTGYADFTNYGDIDFSNYASNFSRGDASDPFFGNNGVYTRQGGSPKQTKETKESLESLDINITKDITPWEAALGTTIRVSPLSSKIDVKVPENARSGMKLRVKGQGNLGARGKRGDLYVKLQIQNPSPLPDNIREAYKQIMK